MAGIVPPHRHIQAVLSRLSDNNKGDALQAEEVLKKRDIRDLSFSELAGLMEGLGEKSYRADQVFGWLHKQLAESFEDMSNVPKALKDKLSELYELYPAKIMLVKRSKLDETRKYLFSLHDGCLIESVFMKYEHGNSVCVSSQAGCRMGCKFCASTIGGLLRDLTASEMLSQVYGIIKDTGERVSNVVIMGSGEPLDNYDNSVRFIRLLNDEKGLNISQRNITLSSCGLADKIRELITEELNITLAISLHAAEDEKRQRIMPVAKQYSLSSLMEACRAYYEGRNRRLTFEYSLIKGFNDSVRDARKLSALLKGLDAHVNLIAVNPVVEAGFTEPSRSEVLAFQNKLEKNNINVTIRRELGRDIEGACGQLRRAFLKE